MGILSLLITTALGMISPQALVGFLCLATAANLCLSTLSVVMCINPERPAHGQLGGMALFSYSSTRDTLLLVLSGVLSNFGYRQYLVAWQVRGLWDFLKGKKGWDKFARKGFAPGAG